MKQKKQWIFAAAALMLAACSNDEMDNWNGEIRLSSALQTQEVQTRGTDQTLQGTQIADGVQVGVFINENTTGTASTTYNQNEVYTADGSGSWQSPAPITYFPQSGNGVNIFAYAPRKDGYTLTGDNVFIVEPNQSDKANYLASDLLWGQPGGTVGEVTYSNPVARTSETIPLVFNHKLSKIDVTLTAGDGLTDADLNGAMVYIVKPRRNVSIVMNTGVISAPASAENSVDVTMAQMPQTGNTFTASAIIPPQEFAAKDQFIKVTLDSQGELYYTLPDAITLSEGKVYKYQIKVNLTGLSLYSKEIVDWAVDGAYSGDSNGSASFGN